MSSIGFVDKSAVDIAPFKQRPLDCSSVQLGSQSSVYGLLATRAATTALVCAFAAGHSLTIPSQSSSSSLQIPQIANHKIFEQDPENVWVSTDVSKWLVERNTKYLEAINLLKTLIVQVFGQGVGIDASIYEDPDEQWSKVVIKIDSNLQDDFDKQFELEEKLFSSIYKSPSLKLLSHDLIISQS